MSGILISVHSVLIESLIDQYGDKYVGKEVSH